MIHRARARRSLPPRARLVVLGLVPLLLLLLAGGDVLDAQRPDSARVGARASSSRTSRDSVRPPLSPRRAFLYSVVVPGYSQSVFGRHKAAAMMLFVEALSIAMIRESAADVREARRMRGDSIVVSYVDPNTGTAITQPVLASRRFDEPFVRTRLSHLEDWIAFLIGNHLFSGADAFVAANLWDVPTQLGLRLTPNGVSIGARLSW